MGNYDDHVALGENMFDTPNFLKTLLDQSENRNPQAQSRLKCHNSKTRFPFFPLFHQTCEKKIYYAQKNPDVS